MEKKRDYILEDGTNTFEEFKKRVDTGEVLGTIGQDSLDNYEIIPYIKEWVKDEIYSIVEDKLEKFRDDIQNWVIENYSKELQEWITSEFTNAVQGWIYEVALPTFLSKLKFPKLNELVEEETETE